MTSSIVEAGIGYFLTPEISMEAIIGAPPTTSITGTGPLAGLGVGEVTYGPAMLVANYTFRQFGRFQPLVWAGVTYSHVFEASGAAIQDLEVDDAMGGLVQVGFDYVVDDHQGLFVTVQKLFVDTTITGGRRRRPWRLPHRRAPRGPRAESEQAQHCCALHRPRRPLPRTPALRR